MTKNKVDDFLRESNAIEGVYTEEAFKAAQEAFAYLIQQDRLTAAIVLETHRILMQPLSAWDESARPYKNGATGKFRKINVSVAGRRCANPQVVPNLLRHWLYSFERERFPDPMKYHITYEKIHPFVDGNGRTGRMFLNWMRVKQNKPILVVRESEKREYYKLFK